MYVCVCVWMGKMLPRPGGGCVYGGGVEGESMRACVGRGDGEAVCLTHASMTST